MHDIQFAYRIIERVRKKAGGVASSGRCTIHVTLSPFTHVTEGSLRAAFDELLRKEGLKDVSLTVTTGGMDVGCKACGWRSKITEPMLECPSCGAGGLAIKSSDEMTIDSIEI